MRLNFQTTALGLLIALATPLPASAATETFDVKTTAVGSPAAFLVGLPMFDTSLGTLTATKIVFTFSGTAELDIYNFGKSIEAYQSGVLSSSVTIVGPGHVSGTTSVADSFAGGNAKVGLTKLVGLPLSGQTQLNVGASDLGYFQKNGAGTVSLLLGFASLTETASSFPCLFSLDDLGSVATDAAITYTYTAATGSAVSSAPTAVPEPGSMMLLVAGMTGIGALRLRRRSVKAVQ